MSKGTEILESLQRAQDAKIDYNFGGERINREVALKGLVSVVLEKFNKCEIPDPDNKDLAHAYFSSQFKHVVLEIRRHGTLDNMKSSGLHIQVTSKYGKEQKSIVDVEIPNSPSMVDASALNELYGYTAEAINLLTEMITNAKPMKQEDYKKLLYPPIKRKEFAKPVRHFFL